MIAKKLFALIGSMAVVAMGAFCQATVPQGAILPVRLDSSLNSKTKSGQKITATLMQDVPLPRQQKLHRGAKLEGHVTRVGAGSNGAARQISFRFDQIVENRRPTAVQTSLRAIASMMEVNDAQVPSTGPDRGTGPNAYTTEQIGGDIVYRGGGSVKEGSLSVGKPTPDGVLGFTSSAGPACSGEPNENHRLQALWVFSAGACGSFGFPGLKIAHAGRTDPLGEITLARERGTLNIRSGSGMLLRLLQDANIPR
jgi:hypothetical protein